MRGLSATLAVLLVGCTLELRGVGDDAGPGRDASGLDAGGRDAGGADAAAGDGGPTDAGVDAGAVDAGRVDAGPSPCLTVTDANTVFHFDFEGVAGMPSFADRTANHTAVASGTLVATTGPPGCGEGLAFANGNRSFAWIADAGAFDLPEGSLDFWIRLDSSTATGTWLSRDANGTREPGHLQLRLTSVNTTEVRIQDGFQLTSFPPNPGLSTWSHLGINWGPGGLEVWRDGQIVRSSPSVVGIDGNDNPFVLAANNAGGGEGEEPPTPDRWLEEAAIDEVRLSSVRRDFSAYLP